jgi:hypothetical protein
MKNENYTCNSIRDDSGGKVNILGGDSDGHCEKKKFTWTCLILNGYRDRGVQNYKYKSIVYGNKEREITVNCILI